MGIWMGHFRKGFAWSENPDLQFNWHPLLMTLGMIYLYGNGKNDNMQTSIVYCFILFSSKHSIYAHAVIFLFIRNSVISRVPP